MNAPAVDLLLVEDDPQDLELTMRVFRRHRLAERVCVARDGAEAIEMLLGAAAAVTPRVVLLDLHLPKVTGIEVLRAIRADPRTASMPVVIVTSSREHSDLKECYQLGVNSYVLKPVDFDQFTAAMEQVGLYWLARNEPPPQLARVS
jgi:CheY-like chemotaxis protein